MGFILRTESTLNEAGFKALVRELIEENPFAVQAVPQILAIEFTDRVPTLAVTREERPRLPVNLNFVSKHCATEAQVKAVICHEFLHVLLRHTEGGGPVPIPKGDGSDKRRPLSIPSLEDKIVQKATLELLNAIY